MALTQEQIDLFHANGYLSFGKVLTDEELELYRGEYDREFENARRSNAYRNLSQKDGGTSEEKQGGARQMYQMMQMCERNIHFRRLLYKAEILDVVTELMGPNIQLFHDQALFKPAHTGGEVTWHQDNGYWGCRPANLVSCWLTLDDVVRENGAMQVVPGSHLRPARHDKATADGPLLEVEHDASAEPVVVALPAGGCMFHHCQTLHYTQPNSTPNQRRALAIHFMAPGTVQGEEGRPMPVSYARPLLRCRF